MRRLEEFLDEQHSMSESRKVNYRNAITLFEKIAEAEFEDIYLDRKKVNTTLSAISKVPKNPKDIEYTLNKPHARADSTWNTFLGAYKRYAKWLSDPDDMDCPKIWRKIKVKKIDWEEKLKDKWLTEQEFYQFLDVIDNLCLKALFCTTVAGALRRGEVLNLKVGDVEISGSECLVTVSGKTGTRTFVMNQFAPILIQWLNFHPLKHDKTAALWTRNKTTTNNTIDIGLKKTRVTQFLKSYCQRAKIKKPVSMHWLRHTKVTWTARNQKLRVNDKQANSMFGWSASSGMYNRYTHLAATDTADTFRLLDGVEPSEKVENRGKILQRLQCFGCNELNLAGSLYCFKCGLPLTEEEAMRQSVMKEIHAEEIKARLEKRRHSLH
ncbi:MAG: site-specific integrase [Candidatus Bathyarchaeota archaeon]|nr:site-specific integrase [Candidatus Termitimicrobium sp.]